MVVTALILTRKSNITKINISGSMVAWTKRSRKKVAIKKILFNACCTVLQLEVF